MPRPNVLLTLALAAAVGLAGCSLPGGDTTTTTTSTPATTTTQTTTTSPATTTSLATSTPPVTTTSPAVTNSTYTVETAGLSGLVGVGQAARMTVFVNGSSAVSSDHIGAHYGATGTTEPSTSVYDKTCAHVAGGLPGSFAVNCTFPQEGTWYLRGHARYTAGTQFDYWGPQQMVKVVFYNVSIASPPAAPVVANQSRTLTVNVTGNQTMGANPVNVVWSWNSSASSAPSLARYERQCQPTVGNVPNPGFAVVCSFPGGGGVPTTTLYARAYVRVNEGASSAEFFSVEYPIIVGGLI